MKPIGTLARPVVAGAIQQFYGQQLGRADYLLIDMPPERAMWLTVFQSLPVEGTVIVSSPQDLVQMVVGKPLRWLT